MNWTCGAGAAGGDAERGAVARTFLTSDVIITEIPQPEAAGAAGGMDAMGEY